MVCQLSLNLVLDQHYYLVYFAQEAVMTILVILEVMATTLAGAILSA